MAAAAENMRCSFCEGLQEDHIWQDWACPCKIGKAATGNMVTCLYISSAQLLSHVGLFVIPWTIVAHQASLSISNLWSLLKLMSIKSVMPSNHLIVCRPLLLPPSIIPSIRVFSNESVLHIVWPKYWSFSFSISPSNEYSGLISFRMDWLVLLAVQGTLKSLLQHHSSKASILRYSAFFNSHIHTWLLEKVLWGFPKRLMQDVCLCFTYLKNFSG